MFGPIKALIPQPHCFQDEESLTHIGLTWKNPNGLTDTHDLQLRYTRNNEVWAMEKGEPQPDGSFVFTEPNGMQHIMTADRVKAFFEQTNKDAETMLGMIDKIKEAGTMGNVIEAPAS